MTVAMSLMLIVLISLLAACMQSLRTACARAQAVLGIDAGLYSLFSEFDRDLLEDYNLFFLDTGYGKGEMDIRTLIDRTEYFTKPMLGTGLTKSELQICGVDGYRLATDKKGEAVRTQIVRYMKENIGSKEVQILKEQIRENEEKLSEQKHIQETGMQENDVVNVPPMEDISERNNPLEWIKSIRKKGIMGLVVPSDKEISLQETDIENLLSKRKQQTGIGEFPTENKKTSSMDKLLLQEYILEKFSSFTEEKQQGILSYQAEYMIAGKKSDEENLKYVINRLLLLREASNLAFLYTNAEKRAELEACASALSLLFLIPDGKVLIQSVLAAGWAYAESISDIKILLEGGKVPLAKDRESWNTQLNHLSREELKSGKKGMDYGDYLRILLSFSSEETLTARCMDMIEENIRSKSRRASFHLDSCLDWISMSYQLTGPEGKTWQADRIYTYDM